MSVTFITNTLENLTLAIQEEELKSAIYKLGIDHSNVNIEQKGTTITVKLTDVPSDIVDKVLQLSIPYTPDGSTFSVVAEYTDKLKSDAWEIVKSNYGIQMASSYELAKNKFLTDYNATVDTFVTQVLDGKIHDFDVWSLL